jgi:hypothetical protein
MQHMMKGLIGGSYEFVYSLYENVLRQASDVKTCVSFAGLKEISQLLELLHDENKGSTLKTEPVWNWWTFLLAV